MKNNWKTTVAGLVAGLPVVADSLLTAYNSGAFNGKTGIQLFIGIGIVVLGALSHDAGNPTAAK